MTTDTTVKDNANPGLPEKIGKYPVKSELGRGGMGSVYLAWHPELQIEVAIKTLKEVLPELTKMKGMNILVCFMEITSPLQMTENSKFNQVSHHFSGNRPGIRAQGEGR